MRDRSRVRRVVVGLSTRALLWSSAGSLALIAVVVAVLLAGMLMVLGAKSLADQQACGGQAQEIGLSAAGLDQIPPELVAIYRAAAARYRLGVDGYLWLAAVNRVETNFGRNLAVSSAGAIGWMQFMPATWAAYGVDGDRDGLRDPWNATDGIYSAANYLHASGAPGDWHRAVLAYNHAEWYYQEVQGHKQRFGAQGQGAAPLSMQPIVNTTPATSSTATPGTPSQAAAREGSGASEIARGRSGSVAFALAERDGRILASLHGHELFNGASLTKAMLLVAELRRQRDSALSAQDRDLLETMIERSDNAAANRIFARVDRVGVRQVAEAARMDDFALRTSDPVYRLGDSRVSAADQARFFARIDLLIPARHRSAGMAMLAAIEASQRWGLLAAQLSGTIYAKAGWRPEPGGGWTVNQAAQLTIDLNTRGIAVLSAGAPDEAYGHETLRQVGGALAGSPEPVAGVMATAESDCASDTSSDPGAGVQLTPGQRAKLLPDGTAAAPQDAPAAVKAMIAAGNRIVGKPYVYGGGHGQSYEQVQAAYDCSSSIAFILFWGGFITDPMQGWVSGTLGSTFGQPGPGHWVTVRGRGDHVFMVVAGLRWDTHRYGAGDTGNPGLGWHTAVRPDAASFGARHPESL